MNKKPNETTNKTNIINTSVDHYYFWYNQAQHLHQQGDLKKSEQAYHRAIEYDPTHSDMWYQYANLQLELENLSESRKAFNKSLFLNLKE